jgi:aminoglycoside phosphotransferase (APT) family kinase protein
VGATRIELEDEAQRASAVRWLGELHASSARAGRDGRLPDLRAPWFRERLDEVRASVRAGLENPALLPIDQPRLEGVLSACDRLDSGWATIDGLCGAMPVVLVHGDFRPKNILVRVTEAGIRLLPIDWEFAGWGVPALDLGTLLRDSWSDSDLALYREVFPEGTRRASTEELFAWVSTGRILRALVSMQWESIGLAYTTGLEKPVRNLAVYARNLERAFQELALP